MSERKLTQADAAMCPKCGHRCEYHHHGVSSGRYDCIECGRSWWPEDIMRGYYAPDISAIAEKLRLFAGDTEWEFNDGEPADLRGWADALEGTK